MARLLSARSARQNVSLAVALDRVRAAEQSLETAREAARAAARREGKKIASLFGDSMFVSRATAERWCDEARAEMRDEVKAAREEGQLEAYRQLERAFDRSADSPFAHIAARLTTRNNPNPEVQAFNRQVARYDFYRGGQHNVSADLVTEVKPTAVDLAQEKIRAEQEIDLSPNAAIGAPTNPTDLAAAIVAASSKARVDTSADRKPGPLAQAILDAGEERRNPKPWRQK